MNLDGLVGKLSRSWAPKKIVFRPTPKMVLAKLDVEKRLRAVTAQATLIDLKDLRERLAAANALNQWDGIAPRDWRYAADCLAMGPDPLIADVRFVERYVKEQRERLSRSAVYRLIRFYLRHHDPTMPGLRRIAAFLEEIVPQWRWLWAEQHRTLALFDVDAAPKNLAAHVTARTEKPPREVLEAAGFEGTLVTALLAARAFLEGTQAARRMLEQAPSLPLLKRLAAWAANDETFVYGSLPGARARMAEAMLLPWIDRSPPDDIREFTEGFLLSLLHDPRIDMARWTDIHEDARRVMRRWLTKASLEQFLEVVDRTAQTHMWAARRKFWGAYYERRFMQEAWVAFARDGAAVAKQLAADRENVAIGNFGHLQHGSNVQRDHAVLIMQIGELTVADWSHNGRCHIWLPSNDKAPKLYGQTYTKHKLAEGSDFAKVHSGMWQYDVHEYIKRQTGLRMQTRDYM